MELKKIIKVHSSGLKVRFDFEPKYQKEDTSTNYKTVYSSSHNESLYVPDFFQDNPLITKIINEINRYDQIAKQFNQEEQTIYLRSRQNHIHYVFQSFHMWFGMCMELEMLILIIYYYTNYSMID